jgi:ferredoxin
LLLERQQPVGEAAKACPSKAISNRLA